MTTIRQTSANTVELSYENDMGEVVTREFHAPTGGGYVREGGAQVCKGLRRTGDTLEVSSSADLLHLIRSEWKRAKAAERREDARA